VCALLTRRGQDIFEHPEVPRHDAVSRAIMIGGLSDLELRDELVQSPHCSCCSRFGR
jgi:hypothetical protein